MLGSQVRPSLFNLTKHSHPICRLSDYFLSNILLVIHMLSSKKTCKELTVIKANINQR